jgi:hypothetical protein
VLRLRRCGVTSLESAYSALGRLRTWVIENRPDSPRVTGSHVFDWYEACPPSSATLAGLTWLRDWCGVDLPVRGVTARAYRGSAPSSEHDKESLSYADILGLEELSASHPSAHVRGHAAGWFVLAKAALRVKQSLGCAINAIVEHVYDGTTCTVLCMSVQHDKHPNPQKRKPRPNTPIPAPLPRSTW